MRLSIIIPIHNEERYITKVLEKVLALPLVCEKEIIVVNDGSTDNTKKILEKLSGHFSRNNNFKLIHHPKNLGKGAAVKTGLLAATGNLIIIQDADLEYNPEDIPLLLSRVTENVSAVYGKRSARVWPKMGFHYVLGAKLLTYNINVLYRARLADTYTGYKLFNISNLKMGLLKELASSGFEFEAEVTCKILKAGGKILEVPIRYMPRGKKEGKHIAIRDGLKGLSMIWRCRFG